MSIIDRQMDRVAVVQVASLKLTEIFEAWQHSLMSGLESYIITGLPTHSVGGPTHSVGGPVLFCSLASVVVISRRL